MDGQKPTNEVFIYNEQNNEISLVEEKLGDEPLPFGNQDFLTFLTAVFTIDKNKAHFDRGGKVARPLAEHTNGQFPLDFDVAALAKDLRLLRKLGIIAELEIKDTDTLKGKILLKIHKLKQEDQIKDEQLGIHQSNEEDEKSWEDLKKGNLSTLSAKAREISTQDGFTPRTKESSLAILTAINEVTGFVRAYGGADATIPLPIGTIAPGESTLPAVQEVIFQDTLTNGFSLVVPIKEDTNRYSTDISFARSIASTLQKEIQETGSDEIKLSHEMRDGKACIILTFKKINPDVVPMVQNEAQQQQEESLRDEVKDQNNVIVAKKLMVVLGGIRDINLLDAHFKPEDNPGKFENNPYTAWSAQVTEIAGLLEQRDFNGARGQVTLVKDNLNSLLEQNSDDPNKKELIESLKTPVLEFLNKEIRFAELVPMVTLEFSNKTLEQKVQYLFTYSSRNTLEEYRYIIRRSANDIPIYGTTNFHDLITTWKSYMDFPGDHFVNNQPNLDPIFEQAVGPTMADQTKAYINENKKRTSKKAKRRSIWTGRK